MACRLRVRTRGRWSVMAGRGHSEQVGIGKAAQSQYIQRNVDIGSNRAYIVLNDLGFHMFNKMPSWGI